MVIAMAMPLVVNAVTLMADTWFCEEQRVIANAVGSMA